MNTYYFDSSDFMKTNSYYDFISANTEKGSLKIRAYSANQAVPVKGLRIIVSHIIDNNKIIFFDGYTDDSGIIEKIVLPVPKLNISNMDVPNTISYDISVTDEANNINTTYIVNMYENICVVQNINVVPKLNREVEDY